MKDIATDFAQFAALRHPDSQDNPETLARVADQFESLFLQSLLKSMRAATPGDPIFGQSGQSEMYQQMFDSQLASELSESSGFGLSELLVRQLGGDTQVAAPATLPAPSESPTQFTRRIWPYASRAGTQLGTDPRAILAQAALETGWGKHTPRHPDGTDSNNFFGIKADSRWDGDVVVKSTLEYDNGVATQTQARFRSYPNLKAAFDDYANFLATSPRYEQALGHGGDVSAFAQGLQSGGYATDPRYAEKVAAVASGAELTSALDRLETTGLQAADHAGP